MDESIGVFRLKILVNLQLNIGNRKPYYATMAEYSLGFPQKRERILLIKMFKHMGTVKNIGRGVRNRKSLRGIAVFDWILAGESNKSHLWLGE